MISDNYSKIKYTGTDTTKMGFTYDYSQNGADWPKLVSNFGVENKCGIVGQ
jgi:hypothetical protein